MPARLPARPAALLVSGLVLLAACARPHEGEVVSVYEAGGDGPSAVDGDAWGTTCAADAATHLGIGTPAETAGSFRITASAEVTPDTWPAGDRRVECRRSYRDGTGAAVRTVGSALGRAGTPPRTA
jgi:hypothetical protein